MRRAARVCVQTGWTAEDAAIFDAMASAHPTQPAQTIAGAMPQHLRAHSEAASPQPAGDGTQLAYRRTPWLLVVNKSDLASADTWQIPDHLRGHFSAAVTTSATTRQGIGELNSAVLELAGAPQLAGGTAQH